MDAPSDHMGGEGLGAMWGEAKTREYLERAGFSDVDTHKLAHDIWHAAHDARPGKVRMAGAGLDRFGLDATWGQVKR